MMVPEFHAKEIKPAKTVGQRLQAARRKKEFQLEDAERLTRVKLKYLKALEEDRHDLLPTEVYSLGFLRCYGEVLGLNTKKLLEQYQSERRSFRSAKGQQKQQLAPSRQLMTPRMLITPKTLFLLLSGILVVGLIIYIVGGVHSFLAPPKLVIDSPKADTRIESSIVTASGETDPTASLMINGEVVAVNADGTFKRDISLIGGLNTLEFNVVNRVGKEAKQTRKVLADYPTPSPEISPESSPIVGPSTAPSSSPQSTVRPTVSPRISPTSSPSSLE